MKTLIVTTPTIKSDDVKAAQSILAKNKFGSFYGGLIDGEFGPLTGTACKAAKYALGFPDNQIEASYGDTLDGYLRGEKLPLLFIARKNNRAKKGASPQEALALAITKIGVKESPADSNIVEFSQWYGFIGAWCAMFVTWCYVSTGSKAFVKGSRWASCPALYHDASVGNYGLSITRDPQAGDVVLYDWDKDHTPDHVGLFEMWLDSKNSSFSAIEGNTSAGNNSNGGEVQRRTRSRADVIAFVKVSQQFYTLHRPCFGMRLGSCL